jgi:hypothetical protein
MPQTEYYTNAPNRQKVLNRPLVHVGEGMGTNCLQLPIKLSLSLLSASMKTSIKMFPVVGMLNLSQSAILMNTIYYQFIRMH